MPEEIKETGMDKVEKDYLDKAGYAEVPMTKSISKEFPNGVELLNCLRDRYYNFTMHKGKIVYGMFTYFIRDEWRSETEYIYSIPDRKLFKKEVA